MHLLCCILINTFLVITKGLLVLKSVLPTLAILWPQCENSRIFLSIIFSVKSIFVNEESQKWPFWHFQRLWILIIRQFQALEKCQIFLKSKITALSLKICRICFHGKSDWQKNSCVSTLYVMTKSILFQNHSDMKSQYIFLENRLVLEEIMQPKKVELATLVFNLRL